MIKKALFFFWLFSLIFVPVSPVFVYAQGEGVVEEIATEPAEMKGEEADEVEYDFGSMTTYEMFWPLVAGKMPGDKFYKLKIWRDKLVGYLFFSKLKKSEYLKKLANKRLVEAERLLEIGREPYFSETIEESRTHLREGLILLFGALGTEAQSWLKNEYAKDLQKHLIVLGRMKKKVEEGEASGAVEESLESIRELIERYKLSIVL